MTFYNVIHDGFGLVLKGQESYLLYQFSEGFPAIPIIYLFWIGNSNIKLLTLFHLKLYHSITFFQ